VSYKILTAEFMHESNTFSRVETDEQAFRNCFYLRAADAIAERGEQNTELAGFLNIGRKYDWQIDHILSAAAGPSGKVTAAAFDWLADPIIAAAKANHYDGILLGLHGAMVTDFCDDGEGELLQRLRAVTGDKIPIAITLDLHANVSRKMCQLSNIIVSYKTYPHVDMRETARHAGEILQRSLDGEINPYTIRVSCPMLEEANGARTDSESMLDWIRAARKWEQRDDAFAVSINGGFSCADIAEVGPTVLVTGEGDIDAHQAFAGSLAADIWMHRHDVLNDYIDVKEAAAIAAGFVSSEGPLVIADYADNPGAGSYGDATNLLRAMLDAETTDACFGPMVDGETVQQLLHHAIGEMIDVNLGGKVDPAFGGGPLDLQVELVSLSEGHYVGSGAMIGGLQRSFGPTAVVRIGGIEILITTVAQQLLDLQQFRCFGIDPASKRVVALKSMQHFRAEYEPIAGRVIVCDSGALSTPDYKQRKYNKVVRPIFPLDTELDDPTLPLPG